MQSCTLILGECCEIAICHMCHIVLYRCRIIASIYACCAFGMICVLSQALLKHRIGISCRDAAINLAILTLGGQVSLRFPRSLESCAVWYFTALHILPGRIFVLPDRTRRKLQDFRWYSHEKEYPSFPLHNLASATYTLVQHVQSM